MAVHHASSCALASTRTSPSSQLVPASSCQVPLVPLTSPLVPLVPPVPLRVPAPPVHRSPGLDNQRKNRPPSDTRTQMIDSRSEAQGGLRRTAASGAESMRRTRTVLCTLSGRSSHSFRGTGPKNARNLRSRDRPHLTSGQDQPGRANFSTSAPTAIDAAPGAGGSHMTHCAPALALHPPHLTIPNCRRPLPEPCHNSP